MLALSIVCQLLLVVYVPHLQTSYELEKNAGDIFPYRNDLDEAESAKTLPLVDGEPIQVFIQPSQNKSHKHYVVLHKYAGGLQKGRLNTGKNPKFSCP